MAGSGPGRGAFGRWDGGCYRGIGGHAMTQPGGRHAHGDRSPGLTRRSWIRRHMVPVALGSVMVVGLAVVTVVLLSGPGGLSGGKTNNSPVGTVAARAQAAKTVTKGSKWLTGSDAQLLTAVNVDLGKISIERHAGNNAAARAAEARLAADASAALAGPMPPVDARLYRSALKDLQAAGSDEARGQFTKAARLLAKGRADIMKVTAAEDRQVKAKPPVVFQPNGQ